MSGKGPAPRKPGTKDGGDEILSVEETVWTLRLGERNPPCNVARFEEMWVGKGSSKRKASGQHIRAAVLWHPLATQSLPCLQVTIDSYMAAVREFLWWCRLKGVVCAGGTMRYPSPTPTLALPA